MRSRSRRRKCNKNQSRRNSSANLESSIGEPVQSGGRNGEENSSVFYRIYSADIINQLLNAFTRRRKLDVMY